MSGVLRPDQNRAVTILLSNIRSHVLSSESVFAISGWLSGNKLSAGLTQGIRGDRGSRWRAPDGNKSLFPKNPNFNYLLLLIIVLFECIYIEKKTVPYATRLSLAFIYKIRSRFIFKRNTLPFQRLSKEYNGLNKSQGQDREFLSNLSLFPFLKIRTSHLL